eukprot:5760631-Pyramimonas_sp.AAC.1
MVDRMGFKLSNLEDDVPRQVVPGVRDGQHLLAGGHPRALGASPLRLRGGRSRHEALQGLDVGCGSCGH